MIFLLIGEDKVWFGRYLVGLAVAPELVFFLFLQFEFCETDTKNCFLA